MDWGVTTGLLGGLGGVALGAWLSDRSQRRLLRESHRIDVEQRREEAYVAFLAAYRQFRRFLQTEPVGIRLIPVSGQPDVPVVENSTQQWEVAEGAYARVQILASGTPVDMAARAVGQSILEIARARAVHPPGAVPSEIVDAARNAEFAFAAAAQEDIATRSAMRRAFAGATPMRRFKWRRPRTTLENLRVVVNPATVEDAEQ
jgi:phage-related protein